MLIGLTVLTIAVALPLAVRWASRPAERGPSAEIVLPGGDVRRVSLADMRRLPEIVRRGEAQNQYGNWRDGGTYAGVLLSELLSGLDYEAIEAVAADGYRVTIERARVEDPVFPMVLAYARDGVFAPDWEDGFRLVVLPESGRVGNEEYRAVSAGSYWVKNVARVLVKPLPTTTPSREP